MVEVNVWAYALISLQTMSGYYGRGNRGISRMRVSIVRADSVPAKNDRIAAKDLKGVVGDAWLPG